MISRYFRTPVLSGSRLQQLLSQTQSTVSSSVRAIRTEYCFYVESQGPLAPGELTVLRWLLSETFEPQNFRDTSMLDPERGQVLEVGPRLSFTTPWSTNAVSVCHACGLTTVSRLERSRRYLLDGAAGTDEVGRQAFLGLVHDRMTEMPYSEPLATFETGVRPARVQQCPVLGRGPAALAEANRSLGLGMDAWDIDYYYNLFANVLRRDPTDVELFQLGQANSEHSRHHFFRGRLVIDGKEMPDSLMDTVRQTLEANASGSAIAFRDNASAIDGFSVSALLPERAGEPSPFRRQDWHCLLVLTAETHNFPSGVAPYPGAETGTGGRIRDNQAVGRGGLVVAGTTGYSVGQLLIPGYPLPWEDATWAYPGNLASPLDIEIKASDGASDYGNCFGEPVVSGFTRSFGLRAAGERREWIKPIMFTGGVGQMDSRHREKGPPQPDMRVVQVGGPAYRIGMGGGAASSMIQGQNIEELDFSAVQRGDPEMEQRLNRVIRACAEMGDNNPIVAMTDLGAGGDCNAVTEIVDPAGARIDLRRIPVGDPTLSALEIWGNESQERDVVLVWPDKVSLFEAICRREKAPLANIGRITGDGHIVVYDSVDGSAPVHLELDKILGKMPRKTFELQRVAQDAAPLTLPDGLMVDQALDRVLRLLSVGSKRFLTSKVDRSVTGLIAQQQCVGPLQLTLADYAVLANSHFGLTGTAISIGEQPIKGLVDPAAMARMSVGEALTNLVWVQISALHDVKCSANWMWAAKLPGEGARLYDAAVAMRDIMVKLGIAVDGGKDSLSMAAEVVGPDGARETAKAPGTLVISTYAPCPDITRKVTPDLKGPEGTQVLFVDLAGGRTRLGGSALAQVYRQTGSQCPDVEEPERLRAAFETVQTLIDRGLITAGHDRSDGGLVTALLEMAFAGNCGLEVELPDLPVSGAVPFLFNEELGLLMECRPDDVETVVGLFAARGLDCAHMGKSTAEKRIRISLGGQAVFEGDMCAWRQVWEDTSYRIDRLQTDPACADEERRVIFDRTGPGYRADFSVGPASLAGRGAPKVAIIREEGSNGDREMASAFCAAGFDAWDVHMTDLLEDRVDLNRDGFRGAVFVGGFSYKDVLDAAKGWAGAIRFHSRLKEQFQAFYRRPDTFSLGVCNGCQLMALLGWVPGFDLPDERQPRFIRNASGRFESRFVTVRVLDSPSVMLRGMADSVLGIWVAHGEGRFYCPDGTVGEQVLAGDLAPVRYVDDGGQPTEAYPFNPNRSPLGVAALCSPDGRHLAMMPHPERSFLSWQWPFLPQGWERSGPSPWLRMFQNARHWCQRNSSPG